MSTAPTFTDAAAPVCPWCGCVDEKAATVDLPAVAADCKDCGAVFAAAWDGHGFTSVGLLTPIRSIANA